MSAIIEVRQVALVFWVICSECGPIQRCDDQGEAEGSLYRHIREWHRTVTGGQ